MHDLVELHQIIASDPFSISVYLQLYEVADH